MRVHIYYIYICQEPSAQFPPEKGGGGGDGIHIYIYMYVCVCMHIYIYCKPYSALQATSKTTTPRQG